MFTTDELRKALLAKGFLWVRGKGHYKLILFVNNKATSIWTVISHSSYDIPAKLHSQIARQLHMPDASYLRRLVECTISEQDYVAMLVAKGAV